MTQSCCLVQCTRHLGWFEWLRAVVLYSVLDIWVTLMTVRAVSCTVNLTYGVIWMTVRAVLMYSVLHHSHSDVKYSVLDIWGDFKWLSELWSFTVNLTYGVIWMTDRIVVIYSVLDIWGDLNDWLNCCRIQYLTVFLVFGTIWMNVTVAVKYLTIT